MSQEIDGQKLKLTLMGVINEYQNRGGSFQQGSILNETAKRLGIINNLEIEQALLTIWGDLFRSGYLAWGFNLNNLQPPFCHITDKGRKTLSHLSKDPYNPDGYLYNLSKSVNLNLIALSYVKESINTFNNNCYKASAVMLGAASESVILEIRDSLVAKLKSLGKSVSKKLEDWRIKTVYYTIKDSLDSQKGNMPGSLKENYEVFWPTFVQQIRSSRNEVGHPTSIEPITEESIHSSLLIFPELCKVGYELKDWIENNYS